MLLFRDCDSSWLLSLRFVFSELMYFTGEVLSELRFAFQKLFLPYPIYA